LGKAAIVELVNNMNYRIWQLFINSEITKRGYMKNKIPDKMIEKPCSKL